MKVERTECLSCPHPLSRGALKRGGTNLNIPESSSRGIFGEKNQQLCCLNFLKVVFPSNTVLVHRDYAHILLNFLRIYDQRFTSQPSCEQFVLRKLCVTRRPLSSPATARRIICADPSAAQLPVLLRVGVLRRSLPRANSAALRGAFGLNTLNLPNDVYTPCCNSLGVAHQTCSHQGDAKDGLSLLPQPGF